MTSVVAAVIPAIASSSLSIAVFKEFPPLPDYILYPLSSPVISSVIDIPDDLEIDELISEVTKMTAFTAGTPLQTFSACATHSLCSQRVKTSCHIVSKSPKASPTPQSVLPDSSNGLIVSAPVCRHNPTISIQPIAGPSHKQD